MARRGHRFINVLMRDGKKSVAERIMYDTFELRSATKTGEDPLGSSSGPSRTCARPSRSARAASVGSTYQVPVEVRPERRTRSAMRWWLDGGPQLAGSARWSTG